MGEIETIYTWRCPHCGRVFHDPDRQKLEEFRKLHEPSCKSGAKKWEHKGPPPKIYYDIGG